MYAWLRRIAGICSLMDTYAAKDRASGILSCRSMEWNMNSLPRLEFVCTNNQVEYEALLSGLEMLADMGARKVRIFGDSKLTVQQISRESQCLDGSLNEYKERCMDILNGFGQFSIGHISRGENNRANALAQQTSGYDIRRGRFEVKYKPTLCAILAIQEDGGESANSSSPVEDDWRKAFIEYINNPSCGHDGKVRRQAVKYTVFDGDLYRWTVDGLLLKCLNKEEARVAMGEIHEGMCGAHQPVHKMRWKLRRAGVHWSAMLEDCFKYYKGCEVCQKFDKVQVVPASMLHPIIKSWPFDQGMGTGFRRS
jgi:hypothetical protein